MAEQWTVTYGTPAHPGDRKTYKTKNAAIKGATDVLRKRRKWAEKFALDTVADIVQGMDTLGLTPDEGRSITVCVDRYYSSYMTINISREETP